MPRPRNQAERRAQLIDAAARAVVSIGATAVKLRDVAEEAGVTPASVLYYYSDLQELFSAVFEHGAATYFVLRKEAIAAAEGPVEQLQACIRSGVPWPGKGEESTRLLFELFPVALRNEAVAQAHRLFFDRQTELYRRILAHGQDGGEFTLTGDPRALGRSFVALEDGYAMDLLVGAATAAEIESRLFAHARTVTGNPAFG
ncbi:TetR/AcrR family transcriptional regulator [Streptomyces glaucus]